MRMHYPTDLVSMKKVITNCSTVENKFKPLQMWVKQNNIYAKGKNEDKSMTPCTSQDFRKVCIVKTRSRRKPSTDNTGDANSLSSEQGNSSSSNNEHGEKVEIKIKILQDMTQTYKKL